MDFGTENQWKCVQRLVIIGAISIPLWIAMVALAACYCWRHLHWQ